MIKFGKAFTLCLVAASYAAAAIAQEPQIPPPQLPSLIDANGVRLNTGKIGLTHVHGSIGAAQGGPYLSASQWIGGQDPDIGWRENVYNSIEADGDEVIVSVDGVYDSFSWSNQTHTFEDRIDSVATLEFVDSGSQGRKFVYVSKDGGVYTFPTSWTLYDLDNLHPDQGRLYLATLSEITRPNGEIVTYSQFAGSPERATIITSSLGYMQRAADDYVPINQAYAFCPASSASCSEFVASQWPGYQNPRPAFVVNGETLQQIYRADGLGQDEISYVYRNYSATISHPNGDQIVANYDPAPVYTDYRGSIWVPNEDGVKSVSRFGSTWHYSGYTDLEAHEPKVITSPSGVVEKYEFGYLGGEDGQLRKYEIVPVGGGATLTTTVDYLNGFVHRVTYPEGNKVEYSYDFGRVTEIRKFAKPGSSEPNMVTSYSYDACNATNKKYCAKPRTFTDERGSITKYKYASEHGGVTEIQFPYVSGVGYTKLQVEYGQFHAWYRTSSSATQVMDTRPVWRKTKEIKCVVSSEAGSCSDGGANVRVTEYLYEQGNASTPSNIRLMKVVERSGDWQVSKSVEYTYDARGRIISEDGPLTGSSDMVWYEYDERDNVTRTTQADPDGSGPRRYTYVRREHNQSNQIVLEVTGWSSSQVSGAGTDTILTITDYRYDSYGREKERVTLDQNVTPTSLVQTSYDNSGRVDCVALRMDVSTYSSLPSSACTQTPSGQDRITKTVYDGYGRAYKTIEGVGTGTERTARETTFTSNNRVQTIKDGKSNLTTYEYDGLDRLKKTRFPNKTSSGSSTSDYEQLTYKVENLLSTPLVETKRLRDGQSIAYSYDALSRETFVDAPGSANDLATGYDGFGNVLTLAANGQTLTREWDALERVKSEQGPLGTVSYLYDGGGRLARLTYPGGFYVTYDYDGAGSPTVIKENGSSILVTYGYDSFGRVTTVTRGNGVYSAVGYDTAGRVKDLDFTLPAAGSYSQQVDFTYNAADQILSKALSNSTYAPSEAAITASYGINGLNQVTSVGSTTVLHDDRGNLTSDGSVSYGYDAFNRMTSVGGGAALSYDPAGRLYQTTGSSATRFLYAGVNLLAEYDPSGQVLRRYVHGPGMDVPLVWYEGAVVSDSTRRYLTSDERGSIVLVTSNSGTVIGHNKYDEYGVPDQANLGRFQYTGQTWLPEVGLYYYKARIYNPIIGRFMQTDPIGYEDQMNLYAYVGNDPMNKTDPTGTTCREKGPTQVPERCIVDKGRDNWTADQISDFEDLYTEAVDLVEKAGRSGKKVELKIGGKKMTVDAKALAASLRKMEVTATNSTPPPDGKNPVWRVLGKNGPSNKMTLFRAAKYNLNNTDSIKLLIVHEGMHGVGGYDEFARRILGPENFDGPQGHQNSYDEAARRLLGFWFPVPHF